MVDLPDSIASAKVTIQEADINRFVLKTHDAIDYAAIRAWIDEKPELHIAPVKPPKLRSSKQHRMMMLTYTAAAYFWPETHFFQPEGSTISAKKEHLRAFVQVMCGHFNQFDVPYRDLDGDPWRMSGYVMELHRQAGQNTLFRARNDKDGIIRYKWSKSISYASCSHDEYTKLTTPMLNFIASVCKVPHEEMNDRWLKAKKSMSKSAESEHIASIDDEVILA